MTLAAQANALERFGIRPHILMSGQPVAHAISLGIQRQDGRAEREEGDSNDD